MLGLGKKKKEESEQTTGTPPPEKPKKGKGKKEKEKKTPPLPPLPAARDKTQPKKKRISIKKLLITLVILSVLGTGGFFGYTYFFKAKEPAKREYQEVPMTHVALPQEMIKFSFDHFPGLYDAFVEYEKALAVFETEIGRIDAIAAQYPDQQKIAERQKKIWENGKNTLLKEFAKLEKPVKETFVLYQVNPKEGQAQIESTTADLTTTAQTALKAAQEMTDEIKAMTPEAPRGFIQGTFQKLKKKFL